MEQETEAAFDCVKLIKELQAETEKQQQTPEWQAQQAKLLAEQAEWEAQEAAREPEDYYILFRDLEDFTPIDYDKRCRQRDWLLGDKASYVWGYIGKLNYDQAEAVETRLGLEFWEKFLAERDFSGNNSRTGFGFSFDFTDVHHRDKPRARDSLAKMSPDLSFLSEVDPDYLERFWFFPEHREMWRIFNALGCSDLNPNPSDYDYIEWNGHVYELGNHVAHWSSVKLFPLRRLEDVWETVGYCQSMDILRHTAAVLIIEGTVPRIWCEVYVYSLAEIIDEPIFPNIAKKVFESMVKDDKKYIPSLTLRQLGVLRECVDIANSIRQAYGCEAENIENIYANKDLRTMAGRAAVALLVKKTREILRDGEVAIADPERDEASKDEILATVDELCAKYIQTLEDLDIISVRYGTDAVSASLRLKMQAAISQGASPIIADGELTGQAVPMDAPGGTPHIFSAASGKGNPKSAIDAHNESIEWADEPADVVVKNPKDLTSPIVKTLQKTNELLEKQNSLIEKKSAPQPVYYVDAPKDATLRPEDCPVEGKGGFWISQEDYAKRVKLKSTSLTAYRKTSEGVRWSSDGTWGESKKGEHTFKKIDPDNPSSEFLYFVRTK
jgi:hypothetical protein